MASLLFPAIAVCVCVQVAPGRYDERGLKSLDFVLETARKYGLQVILSFIDNWKYYNGVDQYVDW
jgi:mannan endo-1,4-beta-mannosidase